MLEDLGKRLQLSRMNGLPVFRHKHHLTSFLNANLLCEFFKSLAVREVDHRVRFAAVTVAAGNDRNFESFGHFDNSFILRPRSEPIDLKSVYPATMFADEILQQNFV